MSRFLNRYNHASPTSPAGGVSMTDPQYLADCDINTILRKYAITEDFVSAFQRIDAARDQFASLPSELRARFGHDVKAYFEFVLNPENAEECKRLGLLVPTTVEPSAEELLQQIADNTRTTKGTVETGKAVAKIWDDWYRDENLQDSIIQSSDDLGDGNPNGIDWNVLRKRGKRHDYFTSALPWTQKGQAIELPLGTSAPVTYNATNPHDSYLTGKQAGLWQKGNNTDADRAQACYLGDDDSAKRIRPDLQEPLWLNADLSRATAATINSLRMAFQLQRLLETDARCGTRLCEIIRGHFKTICPDARLQRSEYLGGSSTPIGFLPVAQTAENGDTPQGNLVAN
ncbi:unnamed protein product, partial [Cylicocyclus nassatus]